MYASQIGSKEEKSCGKGEWPSHRSWETVQANTAWRKKEQGVNIINFKVFDEKKRYKDTVSKLPT